jgi:hypothetical protein
MKRAVLYLRVSTIEQTTANQERELREVASRMGRLSMSTRITASAALRAATSVPHSTACAVTPPSGSSTW